MVEKGAEDWAVHLSLHKSFVTNSGKGRRKEPDYDAGCCLQRFRLFADDVKAILEEAESKLLKAEDDVDGKLVSNDVSY